MYYNDNVVLGALDDPRTDEEKAKDYRMEELIAAPAVE